MEAEKIVRIPLDHITPHPGNRKIGGFDQSKLQQLAESIKAVGVQQPAIVRKGAQVLDPVQAQLYELVAGERRWRASKLAGVPDLPCVVRDLDDVTVLKIQTIENLQREDVHPLDEADGYQRLIETAGYTIEQVAGELGKSVSYVYQRLKLRDLVPKAKEFLIDGNITAGHAILIARLDEEQQKVVLQRWRDDITVRDLAGWIQDNIFLNLSSAVWKRDDAELLPAAGACKTCLKRTGAQPELFADVCKETRNDHCLDQKCFEEKTNAMVARRREELKDIKHLEVCNGGIYTGEKTPKGAIEYCDWTECKKDDKGALRALIVKGDGKGRMTWAKKGNPYSSSSSRGETAAERREREAKRDKERIEEQKQTCIRVAIYKDLVARIEKKLRSLKVEFLPLDLLRLMAKERYENVYFDDDSEFFKAEGYKAEKDLVTAIAKEATGKGLLLIIVKLEFADNLEFRTWGHGAEHLIAGAKAAGVDVKKVTAAAVVEFRKRQAAEAEATVAREDSPGGPSPKKGPAKKKVGKK